YGGLRDRRIYDLGHDVPGILRRNSAAQVDQLGVVRIRDGQESLGAARRILLAAPAEEVGHTLLHPKQERPTEADRHWALEANIDRDAPVPGTGKRSDRHLVDGDGFGRGRDLSHQSPSVVSGRILTGQGRPTAAGLTGRSPG